MALLHKKDKEKEKQSGKNSRPNLKLPGGVTEEEEAIRDAENAKVKEIKLLKAMGKITDDDPQVAKAALSDMMKAKSAEMKDIRETVEDELKEAEKLQSQANVKEHGGLDHQRYMHDIDKKIEMAQKKMTEITQIYNQKQTELKNIQEALAKKMELNKKILVEMEKLNAIEQSPENKKNQEILQELVSLNKNLKDQIANFKTTCTREREEWNKKIEEIKNATPDDGGRGEEILKAYASDSEKLEKLRELYANKNRQISSVKRKIDQVPSRRELQQYQRQFVEVFEQMGVKYTETKQYVNTFNSSEKVRAALDHETKILDSIQEKYPTVKNSKAGREKFLSSMKEILEGMEKRLEQQKKLQEDETKKRNALDEQYITLIEKERLYYTSAKEYQEECKKNEMLEEKLRKAQKKLKKK